VVPKGCEGAGGAASTHSSSSKHPSHRHDPNLSGVVGDVLISPYSPYLFNAARQFPRPALQLRAGCRAPWSGQQEPGLHLVSLRDPSKALGGQGPAREPQGKVLYVHQPAAGKLLPCTGRQQGEIPPSHPDPSKTLHLPSIPLHTSNQAPKNPFHHLQEVPSLWLLRRADKLTLQRAKPT